MIALAIAGALAGVARLADCDGSLPGRHALFSGPASYVADGDSLCVGRVSVRLGDFNAPERGEAGYGEAKRILQREVLGRDLVCEADHPSYRRVVAVCWLAGHAVGDLLDEAGAPSGGR